MGVMDEDHEHYLDKATWDEKVKKAQRLLSQMYDKDHDNPMSPIYAHTKPYYNKLYDIEPGSKMTEDHVLALILYSDTTNLQKYFKEHTRATSQQDDIAEKAAKFAHWFRLLHEAVWIFGSDLKEGESVYHGLSHQLLFERFEYNFNAPLSTTKDRDTALNFCKEEGVMLELANGESFVQPYFPMEIFSAFPEEKEYLFFGATLKIKDMSMQEAESSKYVSYSPSIKLYNFFLSLLSGNRLAGTKSLKKLCKKTLKMINLHMDYLEKQEQADFFEKYLGRLFINFTANPENRIWINREQLKWMRDEVKCKKQQNQELVALLVEFKGDKDKEESVRGPYVQLLEKSMGLKMGFAKGYQFKVDEKDLTLIQSGKNDKNEFHNKEEWTYDIEDDSAKQVKFRSRMLIGSVEIDDAKEEQKEEAAGKMVGFAWELVDSKQFDSLMVSVEIHCPAIKYKVQIWDVKMSTKNDAEHGVKASGNTELFSVSKLLKLDGQQAFEWNVTLKVYPLSAK